MIPPLHDNYLGKVKIRDCVGSKYKLVVPSCPVRVVMRLINSRWLARTSASSDEITDCHMTVCLLVVRPGGSPLYFLADGMRVSLVSISSSSEILSTVVRYSITRVNRSGRREISKMCSMYERLSAENRKITTALVASNPLL